MSDFDDVVTMDERRQITLPEAVVTSLGLKPGDRLVVEIDETVPDQMRLRRLRRSYAGLLSGVYGSDEEALAYVRAERASWDEESFPEPERAET